MGNPLKIFLEWRSQQIKTNVDENDEKVADFSISDSRSSRSRQSFDFKHEKICPSPSPKRKIFKKKVQ